MDAVKRMLCVLVLCLNATQALYGQTDSPAAFASGESDRANSAVVVARPSDAEQSGVMSLSDEERRRQRGLTDISTEFVPKGQWIFGGTASYSTHTNESYQFLIIEGIGSKGYNFRISPLIAYALRDNMAIGGRFIYSRTLLKLDNANLKFGDDETGTDIRIKDFYALRSSYQAAAIWQIGRAHV